MRRTAHTPLLLAAITLLAFTAAVEAGPVETGVRWLLGKVAETLPGEFTYGEVQASLGNPVIVRDVRYRDGATDVRIARFELDLDLGAIIRRTARIRLLRIEGVRAQVAPATEASEPSTPGPVTLPDVRLPVALDIRLAEIVDFTLLDEAGQPTAVIDRAELVLHSDDNTLVLDRLAAYLPAGSAELAGHLTPIGDYPLELDLDWVWHDPDLIEARGSIRLHGSIAALRIEHESTGDVVSELTGSVEGLPGEPAWSIRGDLQLSDLALLQPELAGVGLSTTVTSSGSLDGYRGQATVDTGNLPDLGPLAARLAFNGDRRRFVLDNLDVRTSADLSLHATAVLDLEEGTVEADGRWQSLAWPLAGDPVATSESGRFQVSGTLADFRAVLDAEVFTPETGPLRVRTRADGSQTRVFLRDLTVTGSDGLQFTAAGELEPEARLLDLTGSWQALRWPLVGPAEVHSPQGRFAVSGGLDQYAAELEGLLLDPAGNPLSAAAQIRGDAAAVVIPTLRLEGPPPGPRLQAEARVRFDPLSVNVDAQWQSLAWPISGTPRFTSPGGRVQVSGDLDDFRLEANASLHGEEFGSLDARILASGSERLVTVETLEISGGDGLHLSADGEIMPRSMTAALAVHWSELRWPLVGDPQVGSPRGTVDFRGGPDDFTATVDAELTDPTGEVLHATARVRGESDAITLDPLRVVATAGDTEFSARARFVHASSAIDADGSWRQLNWPLSGVPLVSSPEGTFQVAGTPDDYTFDLRANVTGPGIPAGQWRAQGRGSTEAVEPLTLSGEVLGGNVNADLTARWVPHPQWQGTLELRAIDPGRHWPEARGSINLLARSRGKFDRTLEAQLSVENLSGQLRDQELDGAIEAQLADGDVKLDRLELVVGAAHIGAQGAIGEQWSLDWSVAVPRLAALLPGAAGNLEGNGRVGGPRERPRIEAELKASGVAFADMEMASLALSADIDSSPGAQSRLDLVASELRQGAIVFNTLRIGGAGTPESHQGTATLTGEPARIEMAVAGALEDATWRGRLERLTILDTVAGDWRLVQPVALTASATGAGLEPALCLGSPPARLCIDGQWSAAEGETATIGLSSLNLGRFNPLLPPETTIDNRLDADFSLARDSGGNPSANGSLRVSGGRLTTLVGGELVELEIAGADLRGTFDRERATVESLIDLGIVGSLRAEAGVNDPLGSGDLSGSVGGAIVDFSPLAALVPEVDDLRGNLVVDLTLGGTIYAPVLGGRVDLREGGGDIPVLNIRVQDVSVAALSGDDGRLQITGTARSGSGSIDLSGSIDPAAGALELSLTGDQFQAIDTPEVRLSASPDLRFTADATEARLDGSLLIPSAYLSPTGGIGTGAVRVSDDVVIINDPDEPPPPLDPTRNLFVRVEVRLGDDVRVAAGGFEGRLQGSLVVEQTPQLPPRGTGTIEVASGEYQVYGQRLNLDRGRVLYSGGPLDNPGLDMQAARTVGEVVAGVQIRGSARQPRLSLFSQPAMPDASVLSYLVLGRPPDARSGGESALLLRAVGALGQRGGASVTEDLESATGLDYIGLQEGEDLTDTALVIGKYLTPDLYISYGVGLFDAANTFNVRYRLTRRLVLQSAASAQATGADLLYEIER